MSALVAVSELLAATQVLASSDDSGVSLLVAGPIVGAAIYGGLYAYYRNTDKSHQFEKLTRIDAQPVTGTDVKIGERHRTEDETVPGDNRSSHRERVQRIQ